MDNPLHAKHYADKAGAYETSIVEKQELAHETFLVRLDCPEIAMRILPGQFVMLKWPNCCEPILGRAFALYDIANDESGRPRYIDIVFHVVGKITSRLANAKSGDPISIWGPMGNGFLPQETEHLIMVAGGIGQTPFLAMAKEYLGVADFRRNASAQKVTLCYGARSEKYLAGVEHFRDLGVDVHIATDDGSAGHHGLVTDLLASLFDPFHHKQRVVCCGPEKMMEIVSKLCVEKNVACEVSLETPMACGIGICFSCVTRVKQSNGDWDFKRTCVDGPVFDGSQLVW